MSNVTSGVFPVYKMQFKVGTKGLTSTAEDMVMVKDLESFSIAIEGGTENWTSLDNNGWANSLMTAKKMTLSVKGKRSIGDAGNDCVAAALYKDAAECTTKVEVVFPDGGKLAFNCVLDVKTFGGDSTNVTPLEFDMIADGKPVYTQSGTAAE